MKSLGSTKVVTALDIAAAASADRNGATVDMSNWTGIRMFVKFAAIATGAVTSIKAQQGAASNMSDAADLAGTAIDVADDDDNQIFCINLYKPLERYVRLVIDKDATNTTQEVAWYELYGSHGISEPTFVSVADTITIETHHSPAEGTA